MQTLNIIVSIAATVSYCAMTALAGFAFAMLRRQQNLLRHIVSSTDASMAMLMAENLRGSFREINDMKDQFHRLVAEEHYEDAKRLKADIEKAEKMAMKQYEIFKDRFSDLVDTQEVAIKIYKE